MPSSRLVTWGAFGGFAAGALLTVGYVISLLLASGSDAANITGAWLTTLGFMAFVFAVIGLHEVLHAAGAALAQPGAVLSVIGTVMFVAVGYIAVGSAYGLMDEPLYLAPELLGFAVLGGIALMVGLVLLAIEIVRTDPLPNGAGWLLLAAALASVVTAFGRLFDTPLPAVSNVGGLLIGLASGWIGSALWSARDRGSERA